MPAPTSRSSTGPCTELEAAEALDPLLCSAERVIARGLMTPEQIRKRYEQLRRQRAWTEADQC
jgi:2-oxoisovalerate dehydrogenase E1 component